MRALIGLIAVVMMTVATSAKNYEYKIYFGLSKQDGAVSLAEWEAFEADFAEGFAGFTVNSATGYYLGSKERTRVITIYMDDCREPQLEGLVRKYVQRFGQDSVLVAKNELASWKLVKKTEANDEVMNDTCEATPKD